MKKSLMILVATILFLFFTLTACNKSEGISEPVELHFYLPGRNTYNDWLKAIEEAATNFHKLNPMITVKMDYSSHYFVSDEELIQKLESKESPDIMPFFPSFTFKVEKRDLLYDLLALQKESGTKDIDINEQILKSVMVNGKLLMLPNISYPQAVYYNKTMFDEAKLPYPQGDWTWEQFRMISSKLNTIGGPGFQYNPYVLDFLMGSTGKGILSTDGETSIGYLDSPEAIHAVEWLNAYYHDMDVTEPQVENYNVYGYFDGQLTGMAVSEYATTFASFMGENKKNLGFAPLPHFENGNRASTLFLDGFGIPKNSKHPDLAWKFIEYLTLSNNPDAVNFAKLFLTTSKTVADASGQTTDPDKSVFLDELNYVIKSAHLSNPLISKAWNERLLNQFKQLLTVKDEDLGAELHRLAINLDQELHRLQKIEDEQTESPAP